MTVTGPTFIALQVRDLERAADFYETQLGLRRTPLAPRIMLVRASGKAALSPPNMKNGASRNLPRNTQASSTSGSSKASA